MSEKPQTARPALFLQPLLRLRDIVKPRGLLPIARSTFYAGIKSGMYPKPVRLGPRTVCWRSEEIRKLIEEGVPGLATKSDAKS